MDRFRLLSCILPVLGGAVACGPGVTLPLPVPPTSTARPTVVDALLPPPLEVEEAPETGGLCGHHGIEAVARFLGHYNASDGGHYHGWTGFAGEAFWVRC